MSHRPMFANHLKSLGRTVGTIALMKFVLKTRANISASQYVASSQQRSPQAIISHGFPSVHDVHASVSPPPNGALPKLFPTISRPSTVSPQAIPHGFPSVHGVHTSISLRTELSPSYFPRFPVRPPRRRFHLAHSQRSPPQAISHGFPSVHRVHASILLPPSGALPNLFASLSPKGALSKLFPMVSHPSTVPTFPSRTLQRRSPKLFPTVSHPSTVSTLPSRSSQRSSPQAISHGFLSVHPVVASVSLPARQSKLNENPKHRRCFWEKSDLILMVRYRTIFLANYIRFCV